VKHSVFQAGLTAIAVLCASGVAASAACPTCSRPPLATGIPFSWRDLTPVAMLALDEFVLWGNAEKPYNNVKDYVGGAVLVRDPGRLYGLRMATA
jgi:tripartite-type tricarboxylate transporter receptor subunit TctC